MNRRNRFAPLSRLPFVGLALLAVLGLAVGQAIAPPTALAQAQEQSLNPENFQVTVNNVRSVTLDWDAGNYDQNVYGVSEYEIQWRRDRGTDQGSGDDWISQPTGASTTAAQKVTGLEPNTSYDFRVRTIGFNLTTLAPTNSFFVNIENHATQQGPWQPQNPRVEISTTPGVWPDTPPAYQATLRWDPPPSSMTPDNSDPITPAHTPGRYMVAATTDLVISASDSRLQWASADGGANARSHTFDNRERGTSPIFWVMSCFAATGTATDDCGHARAIRRSVPSMGPPGPVVGPIVVTASREMYGGSQRIPTHRVVHQFDYSVTGAMFNDIFHQAQWFDLDWSRDNGVSWNELIRGVGRSGFFPSARPIPTACPLPWSPCRSGCAAPTRAAAGRGAIRSR